MLCTNSSIIIAQANAKVVSSDTSQAEAMPGFVQIITATDIPGKNSFVSPNNTIMPEEVSNYSALMIKFYVLCLLFIQLFLDFQGISQYAGQAVGLILAGRSPSFSFSSSIHIYIPFHTYTYTRNSGTS